MKRKVFVAVLVICLMLSACGKEAKQGTLTNEKSNFEFSPNKYHLFNATLVETEQFFVGGQPGGQYLYYYDKATGFSDFLCADPSCSHNSRNCGAFIAQTGLATFYEGNRYWIEDRTEENMLDLKRRHGYKYKVLFHVGPERQNEANPALDSDTIRRE